MHETVHATTRYDVVILGAGPAGTCAGLRLIALGYRVAIVERTSFERPQIGESLTPGVWNIFNYLQADSCLADERYLKDLPAQIIWETQNPEVVTAEQRGPGIMVDRGMLDKSLLKLCAARGADVYQPASAVTQHHTPTGWDITLKVPQQYCTTNQITADCIFDARGIVSKKNRIPCAPASIALWVDFPPPAGLKQQTPSVAIEACRNGWVWSAPLASGLHRVMLVLDQEDYQRQRQSTDRVAILQSCLAEARLHHWVAALVDISKATIKVCSSQPAFNAQTWSPHYATIGAAAFTLDPLSSSGVEKSMRFALQTVVAFHSYRQSMRAGEHNHPQAQQLSQRFYREKLLDAVVTHTRWGQAYYAQAWLNNSTTFWQQRSQFYADAGIAAKQKQKTCNTAADTTTTAATKPVTDRQLIRDYLTAMQAPTDQQEPPAAEPAVSIRQVLAALAQQPIKVAEEVEYSSQLCVVGDCIMSKTCINHPGLKQPTAYLGNVEIVPLLQAISGTVTLSGLIERWSQQMKKDFATRLLVSLVSMKVLVAV